MSTFLLKMYQLDTEKSGAPTLGKHLTTSEQNNLNDLISDFLSIKPGKTDLIEHNICDQCYKTHQATIIQGPQAYQKVAMQESKKLMLNQGIIEPLVSEWASSIVPILKKIDPLDYVYRLLTP